MYSLYTSSAHNILALTSKTNHRIQWKNEKGDWFQFRCDSASIQKKWHDAMLQIQKNCLELRTQNQKNLSGSPTLFAFTVRKPLNEQHNGDTMDVTENGRNIKSSRFEQHFFCADNDQYLEGWKKCITEQIAHCEDEHVLKRTRQQSQYLRKQLLSKLNLHETTGSSGSSALDVLNERTSKIFSFEKRSFSAKQSLSHKSKSHSPSVTMESIDAFECDSEEIDEQVQELMDQLRIPSHARPKMLSLDKKHKIKMLQQHALKLQRNKKGK